MKEELFVLTDSGYERLDLSEPSGIQLNYKSNLFGDLSKIECSHTYTFKLPMTINNRRLLDFAEDIRHQSNMIRKRLSASYYQNGVNLFQNANLYIDSIGTSYNAVMTWDVIDGMTAIKDNDIPLNELPNNNDETRFGGVEATTEDKAFSNTELVLHPIYNCGIPYYKWNLPYVNSNGHRGSNSRYTSFGAYPMPVVPVYKILQLINSNFGTKFILGNSIGIGGAKNYDAKKEVVEKGVLPLVAIELNYEERTQRKCILSGIKYTNVNTTVKEENELLFNDVISFTQIVCGSPTDYLETGKLRLASHDKSGTTYDKVGVQPKVKNMAVEVDGCLHLAFSDFMANSTSDEVPVLSLYQRQQVWKTTLDGGRSVVRSYYEWVELDSIDGKAVGTSNNHKVFEFNFSLEKGGDRLSCENLKAYSNSVMRGGAILFVFSHKIAHIFSMQKDIEIFLKNSDQCIAPHNIDIISNLPDISCLTFVKSLFYMMGAFPFVNSNHEISPRFYVELRDNLTSGNVLDWSSKLPGSSSDMPSEIKFATSDFAQSNYYLMKSDDLEPEYDPENVDNDVYASGIGCLSVENSTLDKSKTVIQVPFFAPYSLNRKLPSYDTGSTIKCWTLAEEADSNERNTVYNRLEFCKPEPALGIIRDRSVTEDLNTGETVVKGQVMTMEVWNRFGSIHSNESYDYLQKIIRKPFVIKEEIRLTEFDLLDLDYTRPVYLDKYNSYFAVVSIQRDSNGKCKCELIKLP